METTCEKALAELKKTTEYKPIYLFTGEDTFLIDQLSEYMETNVVEEEYRDFDQKVVYGRDVTMPEIISLAKQLPMLSPVKLVIVKEAQDIPNRMITVERKDAKGKTKKEEIKSWELLTAYLEHPSPQTVIVLCDRKKAFDKRTTLYKSIDKHGVIFEQKKLTEYAVAKWIAQFVNEKGYSITEKCAMLIANTFSSDRTNLIQELEKVMIALPEKTVINDAVIEKYMGISKEYNVFELTDAIGRRDLTKCSRIVNYFISNPKAEPIQKIIPVIYKYIITLMKYQQNPTAAGVPTFLASKYQEACANYTMPRLARCVEYLHEADLRSKGVGASGTLTSGEILKELIFKITH